MYFIQSDLSFLLLIYTGIKICIKCVSSLCTVQVPVRYFYTVGVKGIITHVFHNQIRPTFYLYGNRYLVLVIHTSNLKYKNKHKHHSSDETDESICVFKYLLKI